MPLLALLALLVLVSNTATATAAPRIERVSVSSEEGQADAESGVAGARAAAISSSGRFVAFTSAASNLVAGDANGRADVFLRDRTAGTTTRLSGDAGGAEPSISRGGGAVLFAALGAGRRRTLHLHENGATRRLRVGVKGVRARDLRILSAVLAPDGRHIAILAGRRAEGDPSGQDVQDVGLSVLDRRTGRARRVLTRPFNDIGAAISLSADGRHVAFSTRARLARGDRNRVGDVYVVDTKTGKRRRASRGTRRSSYDPVLSADGRRVAFASSDAGLVRGDTNRADDIFTFDLRRSRTRRVSVDGRGRQLAGTSSSPAISGDGRWIAFQLSPDAVIGDAGGPIGEVYVRDVRARRTVAASPGGEGRSGFPALALRGGVVAFASAATQLTSGDTNGVTDVFAAGRLF